MALSLTHAQPPSLHRPRQQPSQVQGRATAVPTAASAATSAAGCSQKITPVAERRQVPQASTLHCSLLEQRRCLHACWPAAMSVAAAAAAVEGFGEQHQQQQQQQQQEEEGSDSQGSAYFTGATVTGTDERSWDGPGFANTNGNGRGRGGSGGSGSSSSRARSTRVEGVQWVTTASRRQSGAENEYKDGAQRLRPSVAPVGASRAAVSAGAGSFARARNGEDGDGEKAAVVHIGLGRGMSDTPNAEEGRGHFSRLLALEEFFGDMPSPSAALTDLGPAWLRGLLREGARGKEGVLGVECITYIMGEEEAIDAEEEEEEEGREHGVQLFFWSDAFIKEMETKVGNEVGKEGDEKDDHDNNSSSSSSISSGSGTDVSSPGSVLPLPTLLFQHARHVDFVPTYSLASLEEGRGKKAGPVVLDWRQAEAFGQGEESDSSSSSGGGHGAMDGGAGGAVVRVVAGRLDPTTAFPPINDARLVVLDVTMDAGVRLPIPVAADMGAALYIIEGVGFFTRQYTQQQELSQQQRLYENEGHVLWFSPATMPVDLPVSPSLSSSTAPYLGKTSEAEGAEAALVVESVQFSKLRFLLLVGDWVTRSTPFT